MNGCGGRWLGRLQPLARWHRAGAIRTRKVLPCPVARSLSHGSCLLSRVTRRRHVSSPEKTALEDGARFIPPEDRAMREPPDDTPLVTGPQTPVKEMEDAEGHKYFNPGRDFKYHHRHGRSAEGGYVKAAYMARHTYLNPSTGVLQYGKSIKRPLLILYNCNFVEDHEFWHEISVLCDFAASITERGKDIRGYSPEKDLSPVEFIYVKARFHKNPRSFDKSWHITVDLGNRKTWNDGSGFFRRDYHVYVKNGDLSQGYKDYCSSVLMKGIVKDVQPSQWNHDTEDLPFTRWGQRDFYRNPYYRNCLYKATQRTLEPPPASQSHETGNLGSHSNPIAGVLERVESTPIPNSLDEMLNSIRDGASKPASPGKGQGPHVLDHSGNWVRVHEAVKSAISEGRDVPLAWKIMLQNVFARLTKNLKATSRLPVPLGAPRLARSKTARVPRTTKPPSRLQKRFLRPEDSGGADKSSAQQLESQSRSDEGIGTHEEHRGISEPGSHIKRQWGEEPSSKSQTQGSTVPQRPGKSKATTRTSRAKLTIRDPFDRDAGVGQGVPASQELASKASHELPLVATPDSSQPKAIIRPRKPWRRPGATSRSLDLGRALLNAAPEPVGTSHQREAPDAKTPSSGEAPTRSRRRKYRKSSSGNLSFESDSPGSVENDASPSGSGSRNRKPRTQTRGPDARKPGKKMSSPLQTAAADLSSQEPKNMTPSREARGPKKAASDSKSPPAWELPRDSKEASPSEAHP